MMYLAALRAYEDAGIDPRKDIQSFVTVAEDFHEGTSIFDEYVPDQIGAALRPVHTITGDGLHGIATAMMLIKTGMFDIVAVEGHSKASNITNLSRITAYAQDPVLNRPLYLNTLFIPGLEMNRYLFDTGTSRKQCASVVVENLINALKNLNAPYGANLSIEQVVNGPELAWPLGVYDIASYSDGAIVLVLASESAARLLNSKPVWIIGIGWINDTPVLEYRNWSEPVYIKKAAAMAYQQAGISNPAKAIDLFEIDDTYSYKELQTLEMLPA